MEKLVGYIKSCYLVRIFNDKKVLFFVVPFLFFQSFFQLKGIQNFPFFLYGMYSEKVELKKRYTHYQVYVNDQILSNDFFYAYNYQTIRAPLAHYVQLGNDDFVSRAVVAYNKRFNGVLSAENFNLFLSRIDNDAQEIKAFEVWFKNYLQLSMNMEIKSVKITAEEYVINGANARRVKEEIIHEF